MELTLTCAALRPWRAGDEAPLVRHANNRNVSRNMRDLFPFPYTTADAREWLERTAGESPTQNFAIVVDGAAGGGIGLRLGTDVFRRSVELGYWLGEPFWGRGIATEAARAVTDYAFVTFDVCRVEAWVFGWNPASMRVLEKAGFTLEGRARNAVTKDGRSGDRVLYASVRP